MQKTKRDIEAVKYLINYMLINQMEMINEKPFSAYSRSYFCTNENIKNYLKIINLSEKENALSVLSSGDHPFNLISLGIMNIDTFDINRISPYFALGLKRALIIKYNYLEYLKIVKKLSNKYISLEELTAILNDLLPLMDKHDRKFWQAIINYNYFRQKDSYQNINLFYLITQNAYSFKKSIKGNIFLE